MPVFQKSSLEDMFLLLLEREGERVRESTISHMHPNRVSTPQPSHMLFLFIGPKTFWFIG